MFRSFWVCLAPRLQVAVNERLYPGRQLRLNFGASNWQTTVYMNGNLVGTHSGGYDSFSFDITPFLSPSGPQQFVIGVQDPFDGPQPHGKQTRDPGGIFYTSASGIWQTIWLEPVSAAYIAGLQMSFDIQTGNLHLTTLAGGNASAASMQVSVSAGTTVVAQAGGVPQVDIAIPIPKPQLWTPSNPFLYDVTVTLAIGGSVVDTVSSYFGLRDIRLAQIDGMQRILLNNQSLVQIGCLDQGYWPDGIYTAPSDEAIQSDLQTVKELGFNLIRKHVKVEPESLLPGS
jgi:beta-galactosidase/beta-glucuronidase